MSNVNGLEESKTYISESRENMTGNVDEGCLKMDQEDGRSGQNTQTGDESDRESSVHRLRLLKNTASVSFGFAILFTSFNSLQDLQSSLNKQIGETYAETTSIDTGSGIARCTALYFIFNKIIGLSGSFISSQVLSPGNYTEKTEEFNQICGANYCPWFGANVSANGDRPDNLEEPPTGFVTLTSICLAFAISAPLVLAALVDPLSRFGIDDAIDRPAIKQVLANISHLKKTNQILIIPLSIYQGMRSSFIISDFTAAYISCAMGAHMIGYVMMCKLISFMLSGYISALVQQKVGRFPVITLGALMDMTFLFGMLYWMPNRHQPEVFFILSTFYGVADAILTIQIHAFCAVIFEDQGAAFSNLTFWNTIGIVIGLATSGLICVTPKVYVLLALLTIGMLGYYTIEVRERKKTYVI